MANPTGDPPNINLDAAILALQSIDRAIDLHWLSEEIRGRLNTSYRAKLRGVKGGHGQYKRSKVLQVVVDRIARLSEADLYSFSLVVDLLYGLMQPKPNFDLSAPGKAHGTVQLKTRPRSSQAVDPTATSEGQAVTEQGAYSYVYIRLYAGHANADRKGAQLLSLYADRGMGRHGTGGVVAAALEQQLITEAEILQAWRAGKTIYQQFIDHCAQLVGSERYRE